MAGSKGKMATGGVVVVACGLAIYGLLNGFGGGNGIGVTDGTGVPSITGNDSDGERRPIPDPPEKDPEDDGSKEPGGPLRVVVEPGGYSIVTVDENGSRDYAKSDLDTIAKRAADAEAKNGYRVYITLRRPVSIEDHNRLVKRLEAEGFTQAEIKGYDNRKAELEDAT